MKKAKKTVTVRFRITPAEARKLLRLLKSSYRIVPSLSEFSRDAVEEKMKNLVALKGYPRKKARNE